MAAAKMPTMAVDACAKMVEAANRSCEVPQPQADPNWDALAASFGALSNSFAFGSLVLAALGLLAAIGWGLFIRASAHKEAREAAKEEVGRVAKDIIDNWLTTEGIAILRQANQMAQPTTAPGDGDVANEIAANVGEEEE